jgi:hypothetical protein
MYGMHCDSLARRFRPALETPPDSFALHHNAAARKKAPALQGLDATRPMIVVSRL